MNLLCTCNKFSVERYVKIFLCYWLLFLQSTLVFSHGGEDHNARPAPPRTAAPPQVAPRVPACDRDQLQQCTSPTNGIVDVECCATAGCTCPTSSTMQPSVPPHPVNAPSEPTPAIPLPARSSVAGARPTAAAPRRSSSSPASPQPSSCPQPLITIGGVTKSCCSYRWDIFSTIDPNLESNSLMLELDRRWLARSGAAQDDDFCAAIKTWRANYYRSGCSRTNAGTTTGRQRISTGVYRARLGACTCGEGSPGDYGGYFPNSEDRCTNYTLRTTSNGTATGTRRNSTDSNVLERVSESDSTGAN